MTVLLLAAVIGLQACGPTEKQSPPVTIKPRTDKMNPAVYFEIPVADLQRARSFYEVVFGFQFQTDTIDGYQMALFPFTEGSTGITGALAKGEVYKPSKEGVILYLHAPSIDSILRKATANDGNILYPKKDNGELGFVAEIEDSEGNRIGLHQPKK